MLDFQITDEQRLVQKTVREFGERKITPAIEKLQKKKEIPGEIIKEMAKLGLIACSVDQKYGGSGLDPITAGVIAGELARADPTGAIPVFFLVQAAWGYVFNKYGTDQAKQEIFPQVTKGKWFLGIATTEADIGSDVVGMKTQIKPTNDGYIINGQKMYISGVREAHTQGGGHVTLAKQTPSAGARGLTMFYLPLKSEGIEPVYLDDIGREGISTGGFYIENVKIPKHYLIGKENQGFKIVHEGYEYARGLITVICANMGKWAIEQAIEYAKTRNAFGKTLAHNQGVQFPLVEGYAHMEALELLGYKALWMFEQERQGKAGRFEVSKQVAIGKMVCMDWGFNAINDALQVFGAFGYTYECPVQAALRAIRSFGWAEGTKEIMKVIVSREIIGKEFVSNK